jgi:hypothetical protein
VQSLGVGLEHRAIGAAEAERVQVVDGFRARPVEQEPAAVPGVPAAPLGRLHHHDVTPRVVRGARRGRPVAGYHDVSVHAGCTFIID